MLGSVNKEWNLELCRRKVDGGIPAVKMASSKKQDLL